MITTFNNPENIVGKGEKAFSPFPAMFSTHFKKNFCLQFTFILSFANAFSLDKSKKFLCGKELSRNENAFTLPYFGCT